MRAEFYTVIHKVLRYRLFNMSTKLAALDATNKAELAEFNAEFHKLVAALKEHARHEDEFLHPLFTKINAKLVQDLEAQHATINIQLDQLVARLEKINTMDNQEQVTAMLKHFYLLFNLFISSYLTHMSTEEGQMESAWAHYTDEEILAASNAVKKTLTFTQLREFLRYLLLAATLAEKKAVFNGLKKNMPEDVYAQVANFAIQIIGQEAFKPINC